MWADRNSRDPPHPLFGCQSPLDGGYLGRIAILQPPTTEIDPMLLCSREPSEHPLSDHGLFELGKDPGHVRQDAARSGADAAF
jgi:hypothetical protein